MANTVNEDGALLVSKLNMKGTTYTLKDAWARAEIAEIEEAIGGGVHFRGVTTTAIADNDNVKDLTVGGDTYAAADQVNGDIFIYNDGKNNLEFIVVGGKYSELGSTGQLGALAYANTATGSAEVNVSGAITLNDYTPQVSKGTLAVTTSDGTIAVETTTDTATGTFSPAAITIADASCSITTTATAATAEVKFSPAAITVADATCSVTTEATAASASATFSPAAITVAASSVTITPTTNTFSALENVTYDSTTATLTITDATSDAFWTGYTAAQAAGQTVTQDADQTVSVSVTYDKVTAVTAAGQTVTQDENQTATVAVTYDKVTAVTAAGQTVTPDANQSISVSYEKAVETSGTFLTASSLTGDLTVTAAAPTATITNPTVTITVTPDAV